MDVVDQFTFRVEAYLMQLSATSERWREWLELAEAGAISFNKSAMTAFQSQSAALSTELEEIVESRRELLEAAQAADLPGTDLFTLVRSLPAWRRTSFRLAFAAAKQQLEHLRRLHAASLILLLQSLQHSRDTMRLLTTGVGQPVVYVAGDSLDSGGQLLDAAL